MLVGVWAPKRWDLSLAALTQYTVPTVPPASEWIDKPRSSSPSSRAPTPAPLASAPAPRQKKARRPPSRRLVRHVLRARIEAAKALAVMLHHLEHAPEGTRVRASTHLARAHKGTIDPGPGSSLSPTGEELEEPRGWRSAREVVAFLRGHGAKIGELRERVAGDWAAVSSEAEGTDVDSGVEDPVFMPSSSSADVAGKTA